MNFVMKSLNNEGAKIINQTFLENCSIVFSIRSSQFDNVIESLSKNHKIEIILSDG